MKRISSIVWLVLGLTLAVMLITSWFWIDQQNAFTESNKRVFEADDPALRIQLAQKMLADNKNLDKGTKARVLALIADSYGRQGDLAAMAATYRQALALDPKNHQLHNNTAYEWAKRGVELDSASSYAATALALARAELRKGKPAGADREVWARDSAATIGNYLDTYGWVLYRQGRFSEAAAQLQQAFRLVREGEVEYHLGMALYQNKKLDEAVGHLASSLNGTLERPDSARIDAERAYREKNGSLRGFDDLVARSRELGQLAETARELAAGADFIGKPAPDFSLPDLDGRQYKLSDLRGRVVVIDFWATWCHPCVLAMPLIEQVHRQYRDRGVVVCGINLEGRDKIGLVKKFIADNGYGFTILCGGRMGNGLDKVYGVTGIPTSFVIDQNGVVRFRHIGYRENLDALLAKELDGLLQPPQPAIQKK